MRLVRGSLLGNKETEGKLGNLIRRNIKVLSGILLVIIAASIAASLATWSINDPSLSHATDSPARNLLGFPGAVISDLIIQTIGIASVVFVLPLLFWGWRILKNISTSISYKQVLAWPIGSLLAAATFSALPPPDTWPLPTGLGGFMGSILLVISKSFTAELSIGLRKVIEFAGFGAISALIITYSIGLIGFQKKPTAEFEEQPIEESPQTDQHFDEFEEEVEEDISTLTGALVHWYLMIRSYLYRRLLPEILKQRISRSTRISSRNSIIQSIFKKINPFKNNDGLDEFYESATTKLQSAESLDQEEEQDLFTLVYEDGRDEQDSLLGGLDKNSRLIPPGYSTISQSKNSNSNRDEDSVKKIIPQAKAPKPSSRALKEAQKSFFQSAEEFELPPIHFLTEPQPVSTSNLISSDALNENARSLEGVLEDFSVRGEISEVRPGPVVTLYELEPAPGIKTSRVIGLSDDIARSMSAISARVAVIPGKNAIGIELPNQQRETVFLRELIGSTDFEKSKAKLAIALGKKINGESVIVDLARMPHLLVAGTTGSGKSVSVNTMILSLLYRMSPEQCKVIMIDPKMLELSIYEGIPHLLTPVVTDPSKAVVALKWTVREMEERYKMMSKVGVRNIDGFNTRVAQAQKQGTPITRTVQTGFDHETGEAIYEEEHLELSPLPFIVVIVDEMADLMMVAGKDIEGAIQRLAQMARAAGIHLIMATQRPSVDVITGTIKANFPTRISFQVTSKIDSRTILGEQGAEQLLGMGDMLYMAGGGRIQRVHAPFVSDNEVDAIVEHLKSQGSPQYLEQVTEETEESPTKEQRTDNDVESLYDQAVAIVLRDKKASTSYIQRRLSIGYNRAATIIEQMEQEGIISAANHAGRREILMQNEDEFV